MTGRRRAVALVALAVAAAVVGPAPAGAAPETDSTVTRVSLAADGTAVWAVQVRTRLTDEADVAAYERFQSAFRENTSEYLDPFRARMRGVVAESANATGREMSARAFDAETSIQAVPRRWGVVTYEFTWTGFAAREDGALVVGDVFGGQFYLTANDTLELVAPEDYAVAAADPAPDERDPSTVRWYGRQSFADDRPAVRFEPRESAGTATAAAGTAGPDGDGGPSATSTATTPAEPTPDGAAGGSGLSLAAAVLVAGIIAVGGYRYARASGGSGGIPVGGSDGGDDPPDAAVSAMEGADDTGRADRDGAADATGGASTGPDDFDPEPVLTDAERVAELLAEHDGQLKQGDVVEAFDWSKSKTSRVLSEMAEEGTVEKLRIGRENVIRLQSPDGPDEGE